MNSDDARIDVEISDDAKTDIPESDLEKVFEILAQDPRPSYKKGSDRVYALEFSDYEVFFVYDSEKIIIKKIEKIRS